MLEDPACAASRTNGHKYIPFFDMEHYFAYKFSFVSHLPAHAATMWQGGGVGSRLTASLSQIFT
ncbi:hypothetical protein E2C01_033938 [Portunus trituberculatus]|uniref:Uncharacterized protein n=1 Tax=Portunus trituberculatus TaxID=210409 RepID=A0A5B7F1G7_PORTR|nr:hypothetical protein [Portunus trituberculatus]